MKDVSKEVSIFSCRNEIYRVMMRRLGDEKERVSDEKNVGVLTAGIIEWRTGNLDPGRKHLRAPTLLLSLRGGMRAIQDVNGPP